MNDYEIIINDDTAKSGSNLTKAEQKSINKDFSRLVRKGAVSPDDLNDYAFNREYGTD